MLPRRSKVEEVKDEEMISYVLHYVQRSQRKVLQGLEEHE